MAKLSVWANECDFYVAESKEDAAAAYREFTGDEPEDSEWEECPGDRKVTIGFECPEDFPADATLDERVSGKATRTCAEWVDLNGRGHLASTEY